MLKVEVLQLGPARVQKVRIRFLDGEYVGLDMWVPKVRLRILWDQAEAWLRDERLLDACWDASWTARDTVEHAAAWFVFGALRVDEGILIDYAARDGTVVKVDGIERLVASLDLAVHELLHEPQAFMNRHGAYIGPWSALLRMAQRAAAVQPEPVLSAVATDEAELCEGAVGGRTEDSILKRSETYYVSSAECAKELREREPVFAMVRQWCGHHAAKHFDEVAGLRAELARLRGLIEQAARKLDEAGLAYDARQLYGAIGLTPPKRPRRRA